MYALRHVYTFSVRFVFDFFSGSRYVERGILKFESQFSADAFSKVTTCSSNLAHSLLMHMEKEMIERNNQCVPSWKRQHEIDGFLRFVAMEQRKRRIKIVGDEWNRSNEEFTSFHRWKNAREYRAHRVNQRFFHS